MAPDVPLVFSLSIGYVARTKKGYNVSIKVWPVGTTTKIIQTIYEYFGIMIKNPESVFTRGYAILKALKEESVRRKSNAYVVNDTSAWIAFSNLVDALVIGDGSIGMFKIYVTGKKRPKVTLEGDTSQLNELAKALGGTKTKRAIVLRWHMCLLLPTTPTPAFEKTARLYGALVNYPAATNFYLLPKFFI